MEANTAAFLAKAKALLCDIEDGVTKPLELVLQVNEVESLREYLFGKHEWPGFRFEEIPDGYCLALRHPRLDDYQIAYLYWDTKITAEEERELLAGLKRTLNAWIAQAELLPPLATTKGETETPPKNITGSGGRRPKYSEAEKSQFRSWWEEYAESLEGRRSSLKGFLEWGDENASVDFPTEISEIESLKRAIRYDKKKIQRQN